MSNKEFSWQSFNQVPLVGIIRNVSFDDVKQLLPVYIEAGLTTIEITMNTPSAMEMIRFAIDQYGSKLNIGVGTVCEVKDLEEALNAGAQFIVTPVIHKKVIKKCVKAGIPIIPGAFTPTEIYTAWKLGASLVKVYPATSLSPQYITDIKAPLNNIKLLPTGGINLDNIASFMKAGADGVGVGGNLFHKELMRNKDWPALKTHFEAFVKQLKPGM